MDRNFYKKAGGLKSLLKFGVVSGFMLLTLFFGMTNAYAERVQEQLMQGASKVTGRVTDENGISLPGVTVIEKGTTNGAITDIDGNYTINGVKPRATLVFSFVGMRSEEAVVTSGKIDITLLPDAIGLDEVVAVGYGTVKKRDITGSVASVGGESLKQIPVASATEALSGRLAGVQISSTEGAPDAEMTIRVRGGGSITQDNSPLIIVDGFPVSSMNDIAPADIESIDVLKDASSTAIYGSRGANGVIIITTKSGESGKVQVSYNAFTGVKRMASQYDVMDTYNYVDWMYEYTMLRNGTSNMSSYTNLFGNYDDMDLFMGQAGNNWQEQVYGKTGTVFSQDLSVRGGNKKIKYAFTYAGYNEDAIMLGSGFKRDNLTLKLNAKPHEKIDLSFSVRYSDSTTEGGGASDMSDGGTARDARYKQTIIYSPIPLGDVSSSATDEDISSYLIDPITSVWDNDRLREKRNLNMYGSFGWEIIDNLKFKSDIGIENYTYNDKRFFGKTTYYVQNNAAAENQDLPAIRFTDTKRDKFRNANTLNYDFSKVIDNDDHHLNVLAGMEIVSTTETDFTTEVQGFPEDFSFEDAYKLSTQGTAYTIDNSLNPDDKLLSFFGRVNYDYQSKYLLSATFRADGSSRFAEGNKWGYFPSAAFAWRISSEDWMNNSSNWLDDLKLRLSYGTAGNNNIPGGQMSQYYNSSNTLWLNDVNSVWNPSKIMANPDLVWETTYTRNIGLDWTLFGTKLSGTIDAYWNTTKDLLMLFPVTGTGYDNQYRNMGETENKGLEFSLNWNAVTKKDWGISANFNIGFNKNKIITLGQMEDFTQGTNWASTAIPDEFLVRRGGAVGEMYGYRHAGMYKTSDFQGYDETAGKWMLKEGVAAPSSTFGDVRPGMQKFEDLDENGTVDTSDREVIGNANPLATGGFTINAYAYGFDFAAIFNYRIGGDVYNANKIEYETSAYSYPYRNLLESQSAGNRFTIIDNNGEYTTDLAKLDEINANATTWSPYLQNYVFSDWAVEDGSYLRLATLTIGYTLPKKILNRLKIDNLRFYTSGYNLFCITKYSGLDPEVSTIRNTSLTPGVDYSAYPRARQWVFGVNLNF
ncbi:MAG: SusC/RagA family TonB-linked outer membrane protein [Mangrovibacterium sp.]